MLGANQLGQLRPARGQQGELPPPTVEEGVPRGITVHFKGGNVAEYVEMVKRSAAGMAVNIVSSPQVEGIQMGSADLSDVTVESALKLIPATVEQGLDAQVTLNEIGDIFVLKLQERPSRESLSVLSLDGLIGEGQGRFKAETVLTALEQTLGELPGAARKGPTIKFHPESRLLVVKGTQTQIETAKLVVEKLEEGVGRQREHVKAQDLKDATAEIEKLTGENRLLKINLEAIRAELDGRVRRNEELTKMVEDLRLKLHEAEAQAPKKP